MKIKTFLLTAICFACTFPVFADFTDGDFTFRENGSDCTLIGYSGVGGDVTIPSVGVKAEGGSTYTVSAIGGGAFRNNRNSLTSVIIPNSVKTIREGAFDSCAALASITIPNSVETIGDQAFSYCDMLTDINVADGNISWASEDGALYDKSKSLLHTCPGGKSGPFTIPSSVTTIGSYAFLSCDALTEVTIGSSVRTIGSHAFNYCSGLASVTIPSSVTEVGDFAFADCAALTEITIGNSVETIGEKAFRACAGLASITITKSVTTIGSGAFESCQALTEINVDDENISWASQDGALYNKGKSLLHTYPAGKSGSFIIPSSVTTIAPSALYGCVSLISVVIPNSVTAIGWYAFAYCSNLASVVIPNSVTAIENNSFRGCSALVSITIPNSVTAIGNNAFSHCGSLASVAIPNSVTAIGWNAFEYCSSLASVAIPSSVTAIGWYAFDSCAGLKDITVSLPTPLVISEWYYVFKDVNLSSCTLYVPAGAESLYAAAEVWKNFGTILETAAE
ncbi:MAG: leucine-rich repeat domain-containing protein [Tannerellaceae bacterium]|nr:leucine-rich repeat domain-containing protein [Tannerellaceae bacterium]